MLSVVFATAAIASTVPLDRAASYIATGNHEAAATILVDTYKKGDHDTKLKAATMLSSFPPGTKAYADRDVFISNMLADQSVVSGLDANTKCRLKRTMAISQFNKAAWADAKINFKSIFEAGSNCSSDDRNASVLYLGWIEVNTKSDASALDLWMDYLITHGSKIDDKWKGAFIGDITQIWIENAGASAAVSRKFLEVSAGNTGLNDKIVSALKAGMGRVGDAAFRKNLLDRTSKNSMRNQVVAAYASSDDLIRLAPCWVLDLEPRDAPAARRLAKYCWQTGGRALGKNDVSKLHKILSQSARPEERSSDEYLMLAGMSDRTGNATEAAGTRLSMLERFYSEPEPVIRRGDAKIIAWWLEAISSGRAQGKLRERWSSTFLVEDGIWNTLKMSPAVRARILLKFGMESKKWNEPLRATVAIENCLQGDAALKREYAAWLDVMAEDLILDPSKQLPVPYAGNKAAGAVVAFVNSIRAGKLDPEIRTEGGRISMAAGEIRMAVQSMSRARKITIDLESAGFIARIERKLLLTRKVERHVRAARRHFPALSLVANTLVREAAVNLSGDIEKLDPPATWPESEKKLWLAQRLALGAQARKWGGT